MVQDWGRRNSSVYAEDEEIMAITRFGNGNNIFAQRYYDTLRESPMLKMLVENMTTEEVRDFGQKIGEAFCDAFKWLYLPSKRSEIEEKRMKK